MLRGMTRWGHEDWQRLGRAVYEARRAAGYRQTAQWQTKVGRSSRTLLGLERGEPVGASTLEDVEDALGWPRGRAEELLAGQPLRPTTAAPSPSTPVAPTTEAIIEAIHAHPELHPASKAQLVNQLEILLLVPADAAALAALREEQERRRQQTLLDEAAAARLHAVEDKPATKPRKGERGRQGGGLR